MVNSLHFGFLPKPLWGASLTALRSAPGTPLSGLSMQHIRLDLPLESLALTGGPSPIQEIRYYEQ